VHLSPRGQYEDTAQFKREKQSLFILYFEIFSVLPAVSPRSACNGDNLESPVVDENMVPGLDKIASGHFKA
jgi:hypothetical protein